MSVLVALGTLDPTFPPLTCCWSQRKKPRVRQYFQTQNTSLLTVIMTLDLEEISPENQNSFYKYCKVFHTIILLLDFFIKKKKKILT